MESPSREDVDKIKSEYGIHPIVVGELLSPSLRSKVDVYSNYLYLILHFPVYERNQPGFEDDITRMSREIDFVIGKDFLITVHYEKIDQFYDFTKLFEVSELVNHKENITADGGFVFCHIIKSLYRSIEDSLETVNQNLIDVESKIFAGQERKMVERISRANRSLLDFRWALKNHEDVLNSLETDGGDFFGQSFSSNLKSLFNEYYKIWNIIESNKETVNDLRVTNDSLLTTKTNEVMKTLTVIASLTLPLSLIVNFFGMNIEQNILPGDGRDFWIVIAIMLGALIATFGYFSHKKWL